MKILDDVKLDYSDVLLLPKMSEYSSRSEVNLERTLKFKYSTETWSGVPIMVSNMDTTGTVKMALELQKHKVGVAQVYVINTAVKLEMTTDFLILDEIHRYAADTFRLVFEQIKYKHIMGLTATLEREDGLHDGNLGGSRENPAERRLCRDMAKAVGDDRQYWNYTV